MFKSVLVVVGSYSISILLVLASNPLLTWLFPGQFVGDNIPSTVALVTSTGLFVIASIVTAWICARTAPGRAGWHVFWFFVIGEVMGVGMTFGNWSKPWPHWYWLAWLFTWPLSCWVGLMVSGRGSSRQAAQPVATAR